MRVQKLPTNILHTIGTCPIEQSESDEPLIMESKISRVGAAVGLWMVGTIWTGVVVAIMAIMQLGKHWIPSLVMLVFLLIGIGLLVAAVYATLQVFNPKPVLVLSQPNIYPGSEFEVSWLFRGNTKSLRSLKILLEAKEMASFRQGTNTRKEESFFFRQTIVETSDTERILKGFEVVNLPPTTMHSFQGGNNTIEWRLMVKGAIERWPDINDEFPLIVLAPRIEEGAVPHA